MHVSKTNTTVPAGRVLGLTPDKGVPMPVKYIENVLRADDRLASMEYVDGLLNATLVLDEQWDVPRDSPYHVRVRCRVPVDGVGSPDMNLATWRQICSSPAACP